MYVTLEDVNVHLPEDKVQVTDAILPIWDTTAGRIIRGYLASTFAPSVLAAWADPDTTPEKIRDIAGRLIAAAYYAELFALEDPDYPEYAQNLYNGAIAELIGIQNGTITVLDIDMATVSSTQHSLSDLDFWPNDATDRKFTMGDVF